jgi:Ca2+-binding RTX toxin-like protein
LRRWGLWPSPSPVTFSYLITDDHGNSINGSDGMAEVIIGYAGHDKIIARQGNDDFHGCAGTDFMGAGQGDDLIFGGDGHDVLEPQVGADTLQGGVGNDMY